MILRYGDFGNGDRSVVIASRREQAVTYTPTAFIPSVARQQVVERGGVLLYTPDYSSATTTVYTPTVGTPVPPVVPPLYPSGGGGGGGRVPDVQANLNTQAPREPPQALTMPQKPGRMLFWIVIAAVAWYLLNSGEEEG